MLYRTVHSAYHNGMSRDDIHANMLYSAPEGAKVSVRRSKRVADIQVTFSAGTDALAKEQAAALKRETAMLWPTDYLGLQVKTRNGWQDVD